MKTLRLGLVALLVAPSVLGQERGELMRNAVGETAGPRGPLDAANSAIAGLFGGGGF